MKMGAREAQFSIERAWGSRSTPVIDASGLAADSFVIRSPATQRGAHGKRTSGLRYGRYGRCGHSREDDEEDDRPAWAREEG